MDDIFNILIFNSFQTTEFKVSIFDISGRKIREEKIFASKMIKINTSGLEKGIYILSLENQDLNINKNFKIIKQ